MENYLKMEIAALGENESFARSAVAAFALCLSPSLAEISDMEDITRQGARDAIVRAVAKLKQYEDAVGFIKKADDIKKNLDKFVISHSDEDFDKLCEAVNNM